MEKNQENPNVVALKELYDKMQLTNHREATEAFFRATAEDMNATYRDIHAENRNNINRQN